jgi:hypothetical protein
MENTVLLSLLLSHLSTSPCLNLRLLCFINGAFLKLHIIIRREIFVTQIEHCCLRCLMTLDLQSLRHCKCSWYQLGWITLTFFIDVKQKLIVSLPLASTLHMPSVRPDNECLFEVACQRYGLQYKPLPHNESVKEREACLSSMLKYFIQPDGVTDLASFIDREAFESCFNTQCRKSNVCYIPPSLNESTKETTEWHTLLQSWIQNPSNGKKKKKAPLNWYV